MDQKKFGNKQIKTQLQNTHTHTHMQLQTLQLHWTNGCKKLGISKKNSHITCDCWEFSSIDQL